jgi:hypothetical protein
VATGLRDLGDQELANLFRELLQLLRAKSLEVTGTFD